MDYKRKYQEALERARNLRKDAIIMGENFRAKQCEIIFPELVESEDEKIRKEIVAFLKENLETGRADETWSLSGLERWIAWLEKQGEQKEYTFKSLPRLLDMIEPTGRAKAYCQKLIDSLLQEGYTTDAKIVSDCLKQMNGEKVALATMDEKQGEQNHIIEMKSPEESLGIDSATYNKIVDEVIYGEQKLSNKVEPKFKVGDWITDGYVGGQITSIEDNYPCYKIADFIGGINTSIPFTLQDNYHLWTIQDAKDGDVLATDDGNIFVFDGTVEEDKYSFAYYGLTRRRFESYDRRLPFTHNNVHPATKEQRDLLFVKMKEAGYEWDEVNKKLRKIEQKPTNTVEPKFKVGDWVVDENGIVRQILSYKDGIYKHTDGYSAEIFEDEWRMWTIEDAKDGDVLCYKDEISLYKHDIKNCTEQGTAFGGFVYYCCYDGKRFIIDSLYSLTEQDKIDIHPANKEQRDLLFAKMKEAGYEWVVEKKELKKIEEEINGEDYGIDSLYHAQRILEKTLGKVDGYQSDDGILEHKCAISAVKKLYEQKSAWSEEDERNLQGIIDEIEANKSQAPDYDLETYDRFLSWLEKLKQRI